MTERAMPADQDLSLFLLKSAFGFPGSKYVAGETSDSSRQQQHSRDGFSPLRTREQESAQDRSFSPPPPYERSTRSQPGSTAGFSGFGDDGKGERG